MISWKRSLKRLNEEYETAKKKRQALDSLLDAGRISQSTHDMFSMEISEAITEVERQQKALVQKMRSKMVELEEQVKTLEILLANFEIQHVTGEVDDRVYQREINVLSMGLEVSKQELTTIKDAVDQLSSGNLIVEETATQPTAQGEEAPKEETKTVVECVEVSKTEEPKIVEELSEGQQPLEHAVEGEEKPAA